MTTFAYIETNPLKEDTRLGIAILPISILDGEALSCTNKANGNEVIISNFGDERYECEGNCFCESETKENERRSSTLSVLSRGLVVMLSAFTASSALRIAKDLFQKKCVQDYSPICDSHSIVSEVSTCLSLSNENDEYDIIQSFSFESEEEEKKGSEAHNDEESNELNEDFFIGQKNYLLTQEDYDLYNSGKDDVVMDYTCFGKCWKNPKVSKLPGASEFYESLGPFGCREMGMSGKVTSRFEKEVFFYGEKTFAESFAMTKKQFLKDLKQFCSEKSASVDDDVSFCTARISEVSCKREEDEEDDEDYEELYSNGLKRFIEDLTRYWNKRHTTYGGIIKFQLQYRELYYIHGEIQIWGNVWDERTKVEDSGMDSWYIDFDIFEIALEHRSRGFFGRLLVELEQWANSQDNLDSILISRIGNQELFRYLKRQNFKIFRKSTLLSNSFYCKGNIVYKKLGDKKKRSS